MAPVASYTAVKSGRLQQLRGTYTVFFKNYVVIKLAG